LLALRSAVTELLALLLVRSTIIKLLALRSTVTELLALFLLCSVIIKLLALRSTVTEPFALFLLTVAEQSFAVSKLRACLLVPNDAVIVIIYDKYHRAAAYVCCSIALPRSNVVEVHELTT
jgi:hypothetical protein